MNYIELSNPRLFSKLFMYVDTYPDYAADIIFSDLHIDFKILKEYGNPTYPHYRVIIISVKKKHINNFKLAIEKLKTKMLILGNTDYGEISNAIIEMTINGGEPNGTDSTKRDRRTSQ